MRKVALICAATVVGALGITAVASAIQGSRRSRSPCRTIVPGRGQAAQREQADGHDRHDDRPGRGAVRAATAATIHFDKNLVFNSKKFPTCTVTQVQRDNAKCPTGSKVGSGSAKSTRARAPPSRATPRRPSRPTTARTTASSCWSVNASPAVRTVMVGTLKPDSGKYGRKLDIPAIPPVLQNGGFPGLTTR